MREDPFRRHRHTYSFRAWIDEQGSNKDHEHWAWCEAPIRCSGLELDPACRHLRMWDLNWNLNSHNIIRFIWRWHPLCLEAEVGPRYWTLRVGKR